MRDRFTVQARRVLDLARQEADGLGQRYLGPEHVVLGVLSDGTGGAARVLRAHGVELEAARTEVRRLAERGVVAGPRPSDAELLGALGIDLDVVRRRTERTFGSRAVAQATREATRARRRGLGRVPRTPLEEPPVLATQALWLAHQRARKLGYGQVGPELLLLGVLDDIITPWPRCYNNRWMHQLHLSVGLPKRYRGAAGPLLAALGADCDRLRDELLASLGGDLEQGRPGR